MPDYQASKKILNDAEQKAIETLIGSGWQILTETVIERAIPNGARYQTYSVEGNYQFAVVLKTDLNREFKSNLSPQKNKRRGRPPKDGN